MEEQKKPAMVVGREEGKVLAIAGGSYRIIVSGEQTNGEFATIEMTVPPGNGPGPHAHAGFHETFYVLEGEVEVKTELGTYTAGVGSYAAIPKGGIVHCFKNKTDKTARLLCTVVPAGLETFFEEAARIVATAADKGERPTPETMNALAGKYGQELYPEGYL